MKAQISADLNVLHLKHMLVRQASNRDGKNAHFYTLVFKSARLTKTVRSLAEGVAAGQHLHFAHSSQITPLTDFAQLAASLL